MNKHWLSKALNRQKGVTLIEFSLVMVGAILVTLAAIYGWKIVEYRMDKGELIKGVTEVSGGADSWKMTRSSYTGVDITTLCATGRQLVTPKTCGGKGGSAATSNPFGGAYTVAVGSNVSQKVVTVTGLPADKILDLADALAGLTVSNCESATGCADLKVTGNTIALTM